MMELTINRKLNWFGLRKNVFIAQTKSLIKQRSLEKFSGTIGVSASLGRIASLPLILSSGAVLLTGDDFWWH